MRAMVATCRACLDDGLMLKLFRVGFVLLLSQRIVPRMSVKPRGGLAKLFGTLVFAFGEGYARFSSECGCGQLPAVLLALVVAKDAVPSDGFAGRVLASLDVVFDNGSRLHKDSFSRRITGVSFDVPAVASRTAMSISPMARCSSHARFSAALSALRGFVSLSTNVL